MVFQEPSFLLIRRSLVRAQVEEPKIPWFSPPDPPVLVRLSWRNAGHKIQFIPTDSWTLSPIGQTQFEKDHHHCRTQRRW